MAVDEPSPREPVLSARGIEKTYLMGEVVVRALSGVDLDLFAGELVVLLGPSGSGKSTLLNILGGLDVPTAGTVIYRGRDLTHADEAGLTRYRREHVGFVFQFYNLIPSLTAFENVALVTSIARNPLAPDEALALVGLENRRNHFPSQLSGGEQQRVAIARAVAKRPDLLLCDEPTGALDGATGRVVLSAIERINRELGTTTAVITHNAPVARMADRVIAFANGRIAEIRSNPQRARAEDLCVVIAPLDRKVLRELLRMRAQVSTIAMVIASGIASYIALRSAADSLSMSRESYYTSARFADVFAHVRRAPERVADRLRAIDGVAQIETRVVEDVLLDLPDMTEPATARVISLDATSGPAMNEIAVRRGRMIEPGRRDEVMVAESFALSHHLAPGDTIAAVFNGRRTRLHIAGIALSPEYIYVLPPGELLPDDRRFGVLWMERAALTAPFQMDGAFNDVAVGLSHGASQAGVIAAIDRVLESYGAFGAYGRDRQVSARTLDQKLKQIQSMARFVPAIFLMVAAFLVNVVLARTISVQREQIAALKALGFRNSEISVHYGKFVAAIALLGSLVGIATGAWGGHAMTVLYANYFRLPTLAYHLGADSVATAVIVSFVVSIAGAFAVIRRAARLPPAEAMRPEAPPSYRPTMLERLGVHQLFSHAARMVLRDIERRPLRTALAVLGIAFAVAIIIAGSFSFDAIEFLVDVQFNHASRDDMTVTFTHAVARRARNEIAALPGVWQVESSRAVPVRMRHNGVERDLAISGVDPAATLRRVFDQSFRAIAIPEDGVALSRPLATRLGLALGDEVTVEFLEDKRRTRAVRVVALVDDFIGESAYMRPGPLSRLIGESDLISQVAITVDPRSESEVLRRIKLLPSVAGVARRTNVSRYFREQTAKVVVVYTFALAIFASIIAIGVVYNSARIALAMRSRDLASLRVLGFTRREVATILIGEQMAQVLAALIPGIALGVAMAASVQKSIDPELFRLPFVVAPRTCAFAALVVLGAGLVSALLVRRDSDRLDMIAVLKARD